jgi:hypothetical protein
LITNFSALFGILAGSIPLSISIYFIQGSIIKAWLFFYCVVSYMISSGTVIGFIHVCGFKIKGIQNVCKAICNYPSNIIIVKEPNRDDVKTVETLTEIYRELQDVLDSINICYGVQTMFGTGLVFFYTLFTSYMIFKEFRDKETLALLEPITISSIIYATYLQVFMLTLINVSSKTEVESRKILKFTNRVITRSKNEIKTGMLMAFNSFVQRKPLKYSCSLFDYDWEMFFGVSGVHLIIALITNVFSDAFSDAFNFCHINSI